MLQSNASDVTSETWFIFVREAGPGCAACLFRACGGSIRTQRLGHEEVLGDFCRARRLVPAGLSGVTSQSFGAITFPNRVLRPGDTWTGHVRLPQHDALGGALLTYKTTLTGFEMYQEFPCAHVEVTYAYKGPVPGIDAQVRQSLPNGVTFTGSGELSGTETAYYALDRGWALNDQTRLSIELRYTVTANGNQLEVGGTIDAEDTSAVTGYPGFDPGLVSSVTASSR